jgi:hypothetical protein
MAVTKTRSVRAVFGSVAAIVALALVFGFAYAPDTASAAQTAASFNSRLAPAAGTVKVAAPESPLRSAMTARRTTTTIARAAAPTAPTRTSRTTAYTSGSELSKARSILSGYVARYPILAGASVSFGDARGYQAICYYKSGRIVISASHSASLERIIGHEIWHIIDWRDNGKIDWGENVPPR